MIALNVEMLNSFCLPYLFDVNVLKMLSICFALMTVQFMFCENVSFKSKLIPRGFGCFVVGSV